MIIGFYLFVFIVISQRFIEIIISKRNGHLIKARGGFEVGAEHYKFIVITHVCFFISLLAEVTISRPSFVSWVIIPFCIFLIAQFGRVWALSSLGDFWNTRIMILPGANVVAKGPYKYIRHPNYLIVVIEIAMLPLMFQAYWTALIFSIINGVILALRISVEEHALREATDYDKVFQKHGRFVPLNSFIPENKPE
ncbi:isoprenylcysteine carboxylmethyltransferase family protein [Bacillaceae bacterium IKA-2]|nr:isoprenylcysteine carboxylmethyltransferase family protein [Bacillaceae bacterium IKA-2]